MNFRRRLLVPALLVPAFLVLAALPAAAVGNGAGSGDIGDVNNPDPLSLPVALGLFIGIPALGFLIAILLSLGKRRGEARYRPGKPWEHGEQWFGTTAEETQQTQQERRKVALPGAGGASGRW
jgi:hypothetical protein